MIETWLRRWAPLRSPEDGSGGTGGSAAPAGGSTAGAPGGGGASSPSASEASRGAPSSVPGGEDYSGILGEDPDEGIEGIIGGLTAGVPPQASPPIVAQPTAQPQTQVPAQPVPQQFQAQPAAVPPAQSQIPSLSEHPAMFAEALRQNEAALVDALAREHFALTREEQELLETDAAAFVPKVMAKAFLKAQVNTLAQMAQIVPKMIEQQIGMLRRSQSNENRFYQRWPQLRGAQYEATINRMAQTYRMMNPQASLDQMVEELGNWAVSAFRVSAQQAPAVGQQRPNGGGRTVQVAPFVPAVGGPSGTGQQMPIDPWAILGQED